MHLFRTLSSTLILWACSLSVASASESDRPPAAVIANERFDEELLVKPLRDGRTLSRFAFTTLLRGAAPRDPATLDEEDEPQHYTLFPLTLGQILRAYGVAELDLTLNAGQWDYDEWGAPPEPGVGAGAELTAWMGEVRGASLNIDDRWRGLRNALSGLFCASLASMDDKRTTSPTLTFPPAGALPRLPSGGTYSLRHARLPAEHVCTENLTPFAKLLPCARAAGLGQLLSAHKLFDADWHGVRIRFRYLKGEGVELRLAVLAVFDPVRTSGGKERGWSFSSLFGRKLERSCPVASSSTIQIALPPSTSNTSDAVALPGLVPGPNSMQSDLDGQIATYNIDSTQKPLDLHLAFPESSFTYSTDLLPPLHTLSAQRTITSRTQYSGELLLKVHNNLGAAQRVLWTETMPQLVTFYIHTLRLSVNDVPRDDLFRLVQYIPPNNTHPTLLQVELTLPPLTTVKIRMNVLKTFLKYTDHMPDAQRGWDVPGAILTLLPPATGNYTWPSMAPRRRGERVYTRTVLVDLATPDFSMPYNVIIMTCTLVALVFGTIFNLLVRKFVVVDMR